MHLSSVSAQLGDYSVKTLKSISGMGIRGLSCAYLFWSPELQQHHHPLLLTLLLVPQLLPFLLGW